MDGMIEWGYGVIESVQAFRHPLLDYLFLGFTFLGNEEFYLLLVPLLYWVVNKRLATRFAVLFLLSAYLNSLAKSFVDEPRPDPGRVAVLDDPDGGGLPSGHSQNAVVTWGFLAARSPAQWFRALMFVVVLAIGFSRIYLGVHFPHDVLGGWFLGAVLLAAFIALAPRVEAWLATLAYPARMAVAGAVTLLLVLLFHEGEALAAMSTLFGLSVGVPLERARIGFSASRGRLLQLLGKVVLGLLIALLIWRGLRPFLLPFGDPGTFVRYAILGFWVSAGAPWLFVRSGLAERERAP
jgi:membrane-associated phospholipid phosphatase